ncbi:hypothetical protein [Sphingomonas sp. SRS2]|uniref:hypothetical protein n=1 Tax=Sphingomonas sp. SRS2 TaxID=133190 RepID=UPI0006183F76|nr:hypothetical protein [Sphingomonas sp. SRS2]KKC25676.1 hypothetical protein WP12_12795 [Sphingomonas sp. SRS2]
MTREMKEHELASPVDLPGEPIEKRALLWTTLTIATAAIVLLFFNAGTLAVWVDEKPVSDVQQQASAVAGEWRAMAEADGRTAPRDALHKRWKQLQAARFGDEAPGQ